MTCDCGALDFRVGSYSTVHQVRVEVIRIFRVAYPELAVRTVGWIGEDRFPAYEAIPDPWVPEWEDYEPLAALATFVNHSDCDGEWNYEEVVMLGCLMRKIANTFDGDDDYYERFADFLEECGDEGEGVTFC